jgi:peptidoglycan/xylan/chitin deacetylase (PgdA/CDA1 family)
MLKVALTHDVDRVKKTYQYFTHLAKYLLKRDYKSFSYQYKSFFNKKEPYWNFEEIISVEEKLGVKSTFFFLNESMSLKYFDLSSYSLALGRYNIEDSKVAAIIRRLDNLGYEIGLHGSFYSFNNLELLSKEKETLESILGKNVSGIRQHHLNFDAQTWKIQKQLGLKYDSSWGYNYDIGFKDNQVAPFNPFNDNFLVFPMVLMDTPFSNDKNKWLRLESIITTAKEKNGVVVLNWHTDSFNDKEFPSFKSDFINIIKRLMDKGAEFNTLEGFYKKMVCVELQE